jgi:ferritin-like metal-binding protein YciE
MSQTATSILIQGLRNAHSMESRALEILGEQAARLEHFPEVQAHIQRHLAETEWHLERLDKCLDALGEDIGAAAPSPSDTMVPSPGTGENETLNDVFANFAFEHYEIAAYKSLLTLCEMAIQRSIAPLLQQSLEEEEAMTRWLRDNIARLTRDYVNERERKAAA